MPARQQPLEQDIRGATAAEGSSCCLLSFLAGPCHLPTGQARVQLFLVVPGDLTCLVKCVHVCLHMLNQPIICVEVIRLAAAVAAA